MDQEDRLSNYRQRLLEPLRGTAVRDVEPGEQLLVLADGERVGSVAAGTGTRILRATHAPFSCLEVRSESGSLLASVAVPDQGAKTANVECAGAVLEISVSSDLHRASFSITCRDTHAVQPALRDRGGRVRRRWTRTEMLVAVQAALAVGVLVLLGTGVFTQERAVPVVGAGPSEASLARLSAGQQSLADAVARVEQSVDRRGTELTRDMEHRLAQVVKESVAERAALRQELARLTREKMELAQEMTAFMAQKREEEAALKQQLAMLAQPLLATPEASVPKRPDAIPAAAPPPPQVADAKAAQPSPFLFWVEFQDGTSEQNIEQWMKDIKGRRRASDAGWYSVEVTLPQPQTPDGFMEALRKAKIVKAVKTRVQTAAVP